MPTTVEYARHDVEAREYINTDFSSRHREMIYLLFLKLFSNSFPPSKSLLTMTQLLMTIKLHVQKHLK